MKPLTDGEITIATIKNEKVLLVSLEASEYEFGAIKAYEEVLSVAGIFLTGEVVRVSEERLEIAYHIPSFAHSITEESDEMTRLSRVEVARKYSLLRLEEGVAYYPFLHPDNVFLMSKQLYVAHRGLVGMVEPKMVSDASFLRQYKALVISTLEPQYSYEELVTGDCVLADEAGRNIMQARTVAEIERILDEQYHALYASELLSWRSVKKSHDRFLKALVVVLFVLVLGGGAGLRVMLTHTLPRQNRIIDAQAAYLVSNFSESVAILANDDPRDLPSATQHMLAASYVQLSALTVDQRQAILNRLSPSSHENEWRYWIYIGRGQLREGLDMAYSLGDTQLKIHAYALSYDVVALDMAMPGIEKQERLNHYRTRLEELNERLTRQTPVHPEVEIDLAVDVEEEEEETNHE